MNNLPDGTSGADVDRAVEDSPEQRPCAGCAEDPGNCICDDMLNQNQQRGRATGQHEQREQQATLYGWCPSDRVEIMKKLQDAPPPARIEITAESAHLLQDAVDSFFEHYYRIRILAPGDWLREIIAEQEQAETDREKREILAQEFWADLEIEGRGL